MSLNTPLVSGTSSDLDHQKEWRLTRKELPPMVLQVLPKKILIVPNHLLEIDLYPCSWTLGKKLKNQATPSVPMI